MPPGCAVMKETKKPVLPNHRARALEEARKQKMARSASEYVRGSADCFYDWLANMKPGALPDGPPIWICGDCHVGNLGPTANAEGRFEVEIRDFDQTTIAIPLTMCGSGCPSLQPPLFGSPGFDDRRDLESMIHATRRPSIEVSTKSAAWMSRSPSERLNKQAKTATWTTLAEEDIENMRFVLPLGRKFWPLSKEERREIDALFATEDIRELATTLSQRKNDAPIEVVDAAYWKKGCSSLGHLRYAVLLQVGAKSDDRQHCLMDLKQAVAARSPHDPRAGARATMRGGSSPARAGCRRFSAPGCERFD